MHILLKIRYNRPTYFYHLMAARILLVRVQVRSTDVTIGTGVEGVEHYYHIDLQFRRRVGVVEDAQVQWPAIFAEDGGDENEEEFEILHVMDL